MFWPTINSYKRLVDGFWAPVKPTWGLDNRTASFRVIAGSPKSTRLETRCPVETDLDDIAFLIECRAELRRGISVDAVRTADWAPRSVRSLARDAETAEQNLASKLGRTPTIAEVAEVGDELHVGDRLSGIGHVGVQPVDSAVHDRHPDPLARVAGVVRQVGADQRPQRVAGLERHGDADQQPDDSDRRAQGCLGGFRTDPMLDIADDRP